MAKVEIYALLCPDTNEVRYIGKANNSHKRLSSHLRDCRRRKTPVYSWINKLLEQGKKPLIEVLKTTTDTEWKLCEIETIKEYREKGCRLLNLADGGDEPFCSTEQRAINGRNTANKIHSDPIKRKKWLLMHSMAHLMKGFKKKGNTEAYNRMSLKLTNNRIPHNYGFI